MVSVVAQPHVLASAERLVDARMDASNAVVLLLLSALVRPSSGLLDAVDAYLKGKCYTIQLNQLIEDPGLMFGRGRMTHLRILEGCPPAPHVCQHNRDPVLQEITKA